jgi:trehalose utilization protein
MSESIRVTVWNEGIHEQTKAYASDIDSYYPEGIHGAIAAGISSRIPSATVRTAVMSEPEHGLTQDVVDSTDVLLWWGHVGHEDVDDTIVERVHDAVLGGMGLIVLHSGHWSKIFRKLMGTTCSLNWRNIGERETVWTVSPSHPIAAGLPNPFVVPAQEMYGEPFDIPQPDELVFISSFEGGEVFRSGAAYRRGRGRIFYFSPGDQEYPVYNQPEIQQVLGNAVEWAAQPGVTRTIHKSPRIDPADMESFNIDDYPALKPKEVGWFLPA